MRPFLLPKNCGSGGFERFFRVCKVKHRKAGGKFARPKRKWRVGSFFDWSGNNSSVVCDDNLTFMKSEDRDWVGKSEFVKRFYEGENRHRK